MQIINDLCLGIWSFQILSRMFLKNRFSENRFSKNRFCQNFFFYDSLKQNSGSRNMIKIGFMSTKSILFSTDKPEFIKPELFADTSWMNFFKFYWFMFFFHKFAIFCASLKQRKFWLLQMRKFQKLHTCWRDAKDLQWLKVFWPCRVNLPHVVTLVIIPLEQKLRILQKIPKKH